MVWQRGAFWGQCGNVFDVSVSALSIVCFGVYMADIDQELEVISLVQSVHTHVPEPPYRTYGLRVPASRGPYVPEAQGSLPRGHTHCTHAVRRSLRTVRTGYVHQPRACRTYQVVFLTLMPLHYRYITVTSPLHYRYQVVFLTLMVVWVALRLARLATVAKNLHSQRRFSAMQVSMRTPTRGCGRLVRVLACLAVRLRANCAPFPWFPAPTHSLSACRADARCQLLL